MKTCFFYSRYTLDIDENLFCGLFENNISKELCQKCPFFIQDHKAKSIIKKYVFERECNNENKKGKKIL